MGQIITFPIDYGLNNAVGHWVDLSEMALAAIGQCVHHTTIFKMNVESYRQRDAD